MNQFTQGTGGRANKRSLCVLGCQRPVCQADFMSHARLPCVAYSQALKSLHSCLCVRTPFEQSAREGSRQSRCNHAVRALNGGPERAMKQIIPLIISSLYALNSAPGKAMKQINPSGSSSVCAFEQRSRQGEGEVQRQNFG